MALMCKRCSSPYRDPRMLPCLHSFCKACLDGLIDESGTKLTICCPTCRTTASLPTNGVKDLTKNTHLSYESMLMLYASQIKEDPLPVCDECSRDPPQETVSFCSTCQSFLCKECHRQHILSRKTTLNHKVLKIEEARKLNNLQNELQRHIIPPLTLKCQEHKGSDLKFSCTTCNALVCMECTVIRHQGHKLEELLKHVTQLRQKIAEGIEPLVQAEIKLEEGIKESKAMVEKVEEKKKEVDGKIEEECRRLETVIENRKRELLAQSMNMSTTKLTSLAIQIDELTSLKEQVSSCNSAVSDIHSNYSDIELLSISAPLLHQLNQLLERFKKQTLDPTERDTLTVEIDTNKIESAIAVIGNVETSHATPRDYTSLTTPTLTISAGNPYDITVSNSGDVFVANHCGHSVQVFDSNGKLKKTFGEHGTGNGQFVLPLGICEHEGVVFIGEFGGNR